MITSQSSLSQRELVTKKGPFKQTASFGGMKGLMIQLKSNSTITEEFKKGEAKNQASTAAKLKLKTEESVSASDVSELDKVHKTIKSFKNTSGIIKENHLSEFQEMK